jgi:serine protease inhibitor
LAQGKTLNPKFKETIKDMTNVEVDKLDFGSSDSVDEVNDWVNKLTK